jgi:hypothetical protein
MESYALIFGKLRVKIDTFYANKLKTLVYNRGSKLVGRKLDPQKKRRARFRCRGHGSGILECVVSWRWYSVSILR